MIPCPNCNTELKKFTDIKGDLWSNKDLYGCFNEKCMVTQVEVAGLNTTVTYIIPNSIMNIQRKQK